MAFKKKNEQNTSNNASFVMVGIIADVFEGEKFNFLTVNVNSENINPKTNKPYYNTFRVKCDKSIALPLDEAPAIIKGQMSSFFNRDKQLTEYTFKALEVIIDD